MARHVLEQTTSNGLRARRCGKYFLTPQMDQVQTQWGTVRVKASRGYGVTHIKPEHEDIAALAQRSGVPYRCILEDVQRKL